MSSKRVRSRRSTTAGELCLLCPRSKSGNDKNAAAAGLELVLLS